MMDVCDDSAQSAPAGFTFDATHIIGDETQQQQQQEQEDLVNCFFRLATNLKCVCLVTTSNPTVRLWPITTGAKRN